MLPKNRFPAGQTLDYYREMRKLIVKMRDEVLEAYEKEIVPLAKFRNDAMRLDDELEDIGKIIDRLREWAFVSLFDEIVIRDTVERFTTSVKTHVFTHVNRQLKKVMGVDPLSRNKGLFEIVKAANRENVSLIKSIPTQYFNSIETIVLQGVRRGKSTKDIAKEIKSVYKVSTKKAKFIARDQAGSLTGDLTKAQHEGAGLKTFVWSTSGDSNVRDSHVSLDGKVFTWEDGADGLYPGTDYNCRCIADINEEELL